MEINRIKKVIAILLVLLFLVTVTAGTVSALNPAVLKKPENKAVKEVAIKKIPVFAGAGAARVVQDSDDTSQKTIKTASYRRTVSKS